jgi:hypothetical protein
MVDAFAIFAVSSGGLFALLIVGGLGLYIASIIYKVKAKKLERNETIRSMKSYYDFIEMARKTLESNQASLAQSDYYDILAVHGNQAIAHYFGTFAPESIPIAIGFNITPLEEGTDINIKIWENPHESSSSFLARKKYQAKIDSFMNKILIDIRSQEGNP